MEHWVRQIEFRGADPHTDMVDPLCRRTNYCAMSGTRCRYGGLFQRALMYLSWTDSEAVTGMVIKTISAMRMAPMRMRVVTDLLLTKTTHVYRIALV